MEDQHTSKESSSILSGLPYYGMQHFILTVFHLANEEGMLIYWRLVESVPIQEFYTHTLLQVLLVEYNIKRTGLNFNLLAIKILTRKNVLQYG